jgi:fatty acid amide hydrolase 2
VGAHIDHVKRVNPGLNAMVQDRFDDALTEAQRADDAPSDDPFHGVPCSIKECFGLTGMPQTSGLLRRQGQHADTDATGVARYRGAGAIPLGVTNLSELCMWYESDNLVYGRTNNPYDPTRIVGGSSGGEGALVGAGGAPFGLGSDIGGSIRMPAFFNGVFGHKPTGGLVPGTGQYPFPTPAAARMLGSGPLSRRAEDLWPLLQILAGPDGHDPGTADWDLGDPDHVELPTLKVLNIPDNGATGVERSLRDAQARVAMALAEAGADVELVEIPALSKSFEIWSARMARDNVTPFVELMGQGERVNPLMELARSAVGRPRHTLMCNLLGISEAIVGLAPGLQRRFLDQADTLRAEIVERLGPNGVFLFPSHPFTAPTHGRPVRRQLAFRNDFAYTAIWNVLEVPVTQVPLGLDSQGLPLGVQVGAAHGNDHLTIAVAQFLEQRFGGWVPPRRMFG